MNKLGTKLTMIDTSLQFEHRLFFSELLKFFRFQFILTHHLWRGDDIKHMCMLLTLDIIHMWLIFYSILQYNSKNYRLISIVCVISRIRCLKTTSCEV